MAVHFIREYNLRVAVLLGRRGEPPYLLRSVYTSLLIVSSRLDGLVKAKYNGLFTPAIQKMRCYKKGLEHI